MTGAVSPLCLRFDDPFVFRFSSFLFGSVRAWTLSLSRSSFTAQSASPFQLETLLDNGTLDRLRQTMFVNSRHSGEVAANADASERIFNPVSCSFLACLCSFPCSRHCANFALIDLPRTATVFAN